MFDAKSTSAQNRSTACHLRGFVLPAKWFLPFKPLIFCGHGKALDENQLQRCGYRSLMQCYRAVCGLGCMQQALSQGVHLWVYCWQAGRRRRCACRALPEHTMDLQVDVSG